MSRTFLNPMTITITLTQDIMDALDENAVLALRPELIKSWYLEKEIIYEDLDGEPRRDTLRCRRIGNYLLCWPAIDESEPDEAVEYTEAIQYDRGNELEYFRNYIDQYIEFRGFPI